MGYVNVDIDNDLEKDFRRVIVDVHGGKKGALKTAIEEAIKLWIQEHKNA